VRLLEKGASLYDVAKLLGISQQTADSSYSPYCLELQARGAALMRKLDYGN
jgi:predicted transcriptional regulator